MKNAAVTPPAGPTWLETLGFTDNPFYLYPVPADDVSIGKGFIDRDTEKDLVRNYTELRGYKLLILGAVGEGKSSFLNLFLNTGRKLDKNAITLDAQNISDREAFIEALLKSLLSYTDRMEKEQAKLLNDRLTVLGIAKKTETVSKEVSAELSAKLIAVVAALSGKVGAKSAKSEEIEYYTPPRIKLLEAINNEVLPQIFQSADFMLLLDNAQASLLTEVAQILPSNILLIATINDETFRDPEVYPKMTNAFHGNLPMPKIERSTLETFVNGRIKKFSKTGKPPITIDKAAMDLLHDFTRGNLRKSFQLCFQALMKHKRDIDANMLQGEINQECSMLAKSLDAIDAKIMNILARSDGLTVKQLHNKGLKDATSQRNLFDRIASLESKVLIRTREKREEKRKPLRVHYVSESMKDFFAHL